MWTLRADLPPPDFLLNPCANVRAAPILMCNNLEYLNICITFQSF